VRVTLNGDPRDVRPGTTVAAVVLEAGVAPDERGVAVAVDGEVVPRTRWGGTSLEPEARVEILRATAGG
jgi:sulfur carrier protein